MDEQDDKPANTLKKAGSQNEPARPRFRCWTMEEMMALPPVTLREEAAQLLESAAQYLRARPNGECDANAAWRVADAGLILSRKIRAKGKSVVGVHVRTGRGAILPHERRKS